jgi:adenylate cyclase
MGDVPAQRRLAAILAADVAGYGRLIEQDESGTLTALKERRRDILEPLLRQHQGRIVKVMGDGVLAEFGSAVNAVSCAVDLQKKMMAANEGLPDDRRIALRVAINLGDVVVEGGDLFGDGVIIAARLEAMAEPGGILITGAVHDHVKSKLRLDFRDLGSQRLKNVQEPVRVYGVVGALRATDSHLTLPRLSIVVLPFTTLSSDPEHGYVADGIVEEITSALSRVRSLFVIARNSAFAYKDRAVDVKQVSRELGVRYVLQGSVRHADDRIRINAQLTDAVEGNNIWVDRYEGAIANLFDLQDGIAESIVGVLEPTILAAEIQRARRKRPGNLDGYDLFLRALPLAWSCTRTGNSEALLLLNKSVALDPDYAPAHALASWCHGQQLVYHWAEEIEEPKQAALNLARRAVELDQDDPMVLAMLGAAESVVGHLESAHMHLQRALALDPNSAWAWNRSGWAKNYLAIQDAAIKDFERAIRLSPFDPMHFNCLFGIGVAHMIAGRFEDGVHWMERALLEKPDAVWIRRSLAPCYALAGRQSQAQEAVQLLRRDYPDLTVAKVAAVIPSGESCLRQYHCEGLRRAGLPE